MALASRKVGTIHNKTGDDLLALKAKYDNNKHTELEVFEGEAALIYQMQLLKEDVDELRRFIISEVGSTNYDDKIKVLPNMFMSNDDANLERVMVEDDTANNFSIRVGSSTIEMYAMIEIPKGKKVTHGQVYASQNRSCQFYNVNYTTGAASIAVVGNANSNQAFTDSRTGASTAVSSTATNYLLIKVVTTSTLDKIYGAELTIADI
ncbi:hypothetical protein OAA03_00485 [bacterium]|nr:hypothetical protein [bacterium]